MEERDTLFRELSDLNNVYSEDPFLEMFRIEEPYKPTIFGDCYNSLEPGIKKVISEQVGKEFRRVTGFVGKLPLLSNARNEKERKLVTTWLRFRDYIVRRQGQKLCPDMAIRRVPIITLKDLFDFEALGGITLSMHGPLIPDDDLQARLLTQVRIIKDRFGSSKNIDEHEWSNYVYDRIMVGVFVGGGYPTDTIEVTKWANYNIMLDVINKAIQKAWNYSSTLGDSSPAGGFAFTWRTPVGSGYIYEQTKDQTITPISGIRAGRIEIKETQNNPLGWYIYSAFPSRLYETGPIIGGSE